MLFNLNSCIFVKINKNNITDCLKSRLSHIREFRFFYHTENFQLKIESIRDNIKEYIINCPNRCIISEGSLSRILSIVDKNNISFAIISAYRKEFSKQQNIIN